MVDVKAHDRGGSPVKAHTRSPPARGSQAAAAVAITLALSGVAGGTSAVEGSASVDYSGTRTSSRSGSEARAGGTEVRIAGDEDSLRATIRLQRMGGHPTKLDAQSSKRNCGDNSDGDVQSFFRKHECTTLYRTLIEYRDGDYVIRFLIATVEMPDDSTATDLHSLLSSDHIGDITPLSPTKGEYHHVPFTVGLSTTTLQDTVVTNTRTQAVGRTPRAEALGFLTTSLLFGLG